MPPIVPNLLPRIRPVEKPPRLPSTAVRAMSAGVQSGGLGSRKLTAQLLLNVLIITDASSRTASLPGDTRVSLL